MPTRWPRASAAWPTTVRSRARLGAGRANGRRGVQLGPARRTARGALHRGACVDPMISDRLLALVRCPDCRGTHRSRRRLGRRPALPDVRTRLPRARRRLPRPAAGGRVRRADQVPRRGAARRRAARARLAAAARIEDPQRHAARVPRAASPAISSSISAAAAAARCSGTATSAPTTVGIDISPFFSAGRAARRRPAARRPAAAAVCRRHVHEGVVARRARAPVARGAARHAARKRTACSRRAARCSSTPTSARTRRSPPACAGSTAGARGSSASGLIDMRQERLRKSDHLNPLATFPTSSASPRDAGFRIAPHHASTRRSSAASSRTS